MTTDTHFSKSALVSVSDPLIGKILKLVPQTAQGVRLYDPNAHFLYDWNLTAAQLDLLFLEVEEAFNVKTPELFSEAVGSVQGLADYVRAQA